MSIEPPNKSQMNLGSAGWLALPVGIFATIAILFGVALKPGGDPSRLPSVFIGKPAPAYAFAAIPDIAIPTATGFDQKSLAKPGTATVVNFFASWCAPCVDEHPQLLELAKIPGTVLIGVNEKDEPASARQFLSRYGNPYAVIGADRNGRGAIEWGVYGTPETFIIDAAGRIAYKHVGPISPETLQTVFKPAIEAAKAAKPGG